MRRSKTLSRLGLLPLVLVVVAAACTTSSGGDDASNADADGTAATTEPVGDTTSRR